MMDVQRVIEVWISKVGNAPAEIFYSPYIYMDLRSRHKSLPAIVSAAELMAAQVHALMLLEVESEKDPVATELLQRGRRLETRIVEGRITRTWAEGITSYDIEDTEGNTLGEILEGMLKRGSLVARVAVNDPDDLPREEPRRGE